MDNKYFGFVSYLVDLLNSNNYQVIFIMVFVLTLFKIRAIYDFLLNLSRQKEQYFLEKLKNTDSLSIENKLLIKKHFNNIVSSKLFGARTDEIMTREIVKFHRRHPSIELFDIIGARKYYLLDEDGNMKIVYGFLDRLMFLLWIVIASMSIFFAIYLSFSAFFIVFLHKQIDLAIQQIISAVIYASIAFLVFYLTGSERSVCRIRKLIKESSGHQKTDC